MILTEDHVRLVGPWRSHARAERKVKRQVLLNLTSH